MSVEGARPAYHDGEREVQARFGVEARMAEIGSRTIRSFMPEQHRTFFAQLPFVVLGAADRAGDVWASILWAEPGFVSTPDAQTLRIGAGPAHDDPLSGALFEDARLALLGIELHTRRRNRANGRIVSLAPDAIELAIDQSFGNCPQYIWPRGVEAPAPLGEPAPAEPVNLQDLRVQSLIARADTFFIASRSEGDPANRTTGADVSHRGGRPGFIEIRDGALIWPEYKGNFFFNTLGNIARDPACGLIIPDFATGDALQLSGAAAILWDQAAAPDPNDVLEEMCKLRFAPRAIHYRRGIVPPGWRTLGGAACAAGPL